MFHIVHPADQRRTENGTVAFEGRPYGGGISTFLVDFGQGEGPPLHRHPYSETWVVRAGRAAMIVGEEVSTVTAGDIIVVPADVPHRFVNIDASRLDMTCIHASDHFIQENLVAA